MPDKISKEEYTIPTKLPMLNIAQTKIGAKNHAKEMTPATIKTILKTKNILQFKISPPILSNTLNIFYRPLTRTNLKRFYFFSLKTISFEKK